ncbi:MAG: SusC/RagA family TonB-linked outer membrane protein [Bacteroidota bacterium]
MKLKLNNFTKFVLLIALLACSNFALAQRTVTGTVTDGETDEPLIGATVIVVGTSNGAITDFDGKYSIEVEEGQTQLEFSYTGFANTVVELGASNVVDVQLKAGTVLDEVVVIGYGSVRKQDATGAVDVVGEEDFNQGFQTTPEQLIQGRLAGVQITGSSGEPGAAVDIRIRGASSIRSGNNPLIVLDGIPLDGRDISAGADVGAGRQSARNPLNFINPADIESISVLKDASATAIYGSRGANGVILITTKKGTSGKPTVELSSSIGINTMPEGRKYDLLSADRFVTETNNSNIDFGDDVNAFDEILRTGVVQNHNLTYGGSTESGGRYRLSVGIQDQEGIIKDTGLKKYSGTINITQSLFNDRVDVGGKMIASFINDQAAALSDQVGAEGDMMVSALRWNPTRPFSDVAGFIQPSDNERNPLAFLEYYDDVTETSRIFGNIFANVKIIDGLTYKFNYGIDRSESSRRVAVSRLLNANFAIGSGGIGVIDNIEAYTQLFEHTLEYNKDLNSNVGLNAIVGYSYQEFIRKGNTQRGTGYSVDDQSLYVNNLNFASSFPPNDNSSFFDPKDELQSFFGRLNFDINGKYLITGTVRADGSSRFGDDNKYGVFPSAAVAWKISEEDFAPEVFDDLKLRVGWGITGNQEFPSGSAQTVFKPLDDGSGLQQDNIGNPALQWEETTQYNVGIDFGFGDYRFTGSIDYFFKQTEDLLFRLRAAQPGPDVFVWRNLEGVTVDNSGLEFNINALLVDKSDFNWELGFNASYYQNEINGVSNIFPAGIITGEINGQGLSNQRGQLLFDGQPLYAFYLPVFNGFNSEGIAQYEDINGDNENTASGIVPPGLGDRKFVGDPNPDFTIGFRSAVRYKDFDVSVYLQGAFGHQVFDNTALALFSRAALEGGANVDERVLSTAQVAGDAPIPSTLFLEDADHVRLANLTIGYTFPVPETMTWLSSLRLFLTGQNLFLITGYKGFDPEVNKNKNVDDVPSFGIDYAAYPRARTFTLGVNAVF